MIPTASPRERVLRTAEIAPSAVRYQVLNTTAFLVATVIGIVALPLAVPIAWWYWGRHYDRLRVVVTSRDLKVHRGILNTEEKSIPLEKITDLATFQGPIMRAMGLKGIKVETAGQSSGASALVSIVGIVDTDGFRDTVLQQRDRIADRDDVPAGTVAGPGRSASADPDLLAVVTEIRDAITRIEAGLSAR
jgi:putative membrane protein